MRTDRRHAGLLFVKEPNCVAEAVASLPEDRELVQNAVEHAFVGLPGGSIVVRLAEQGDSLYVEIHDDGRGLPHDFDPAHQGGLGLQIVRSLVREDLKGEFELTNGQGVHAIVSFPKWIAKVE